MSLKAHVVHDPVTGDVRLYLRDFDRWRSPKVRYAVGVAWEEKDEHDGQPPKPLHVDTQAMRDDGLALCQALLDALWSSGLRPLGYQDTRESVAALNRHLADMRVLAFAPLGKEPPK